MSVTILGRVETVAGLLLMAPVPVPMSFPSPVQDYFNSEVILVRVFVKDRAATFLRVSGQTKDGARISGM